MPFAERDGAHLYWRLDGQMAKPPLVLLNSIGSDLSLWDRALPFLLRDFRTLRVDTRGHGASDAPAGDYRMAELAADMLAVMDVAGIERAAVAGVSLGGMIAMEMALVAPERIEALALICTSAAMDRAAWEERIGKVRGGGMAAIADLAMGRFLSPDFAAARPEIADTLRRGLLATAKDGYAGCAAAIRDMDLIDRIGSIAAPTLVVTGSRDISTPAADHGDRIAAAIPGASQANLASAHLAPIEAPGALATLLHEFLIEPRTAKNAVRTLYEEGVTNRRRVLGDDWVDTALATRTPFNAEFQEMITRTAWREIWGRPGLDERTRRLLVVAITAALGRWEEFRLHVRAGLTRHGFTADELKEVLMQTGIYAGLPAANTAFAEAAEIISEIEGEGR